MMTNLFSSFDPSTTLMLTTNWLSSFLFMLFITGPMWFLPNRLNLIWQKITITLHQEFKVLLGANSLNGATIILISVFLLIFFNNFMGLYPYIFTSSSHLLMTLTISLPLWLAFMLFGWFTNTKHMFAHLVPQSTPVPLMPFMVIIETISNMIRPGTLAVRLAANMIAGHLLMTLLGNQTASVSVSIIWVLLIVQILLLTLESAVAIIQSYVFAVLTTLYSSEVTS